MVSGMTDTNHNDNDPVLSGFGYGPQFRAKVLAEVDGGLSVTHAALKNGMGVKTGPKTVRKWLDQRDAANDLQTRVTNLEKRLDRMAEAIR